MISAFLYFPVCKPQLYDAFFTFFNLEERVFGENLADKASSPGHTSVTYDCTLKHNLRRKCLFLRM